jgi:hypothetical protein
MPADTITPPLPVTRCAADQWRVDRNLTITEMAAACGLKQSELSRCFFPVDHPQWREATLRIRKAVRDYTGGLVGLEDWPEKSVPAAPVDSRAFQHRGAA